ncbi:hypothetical protein ACX1IQ_21130 [Yersinia enterocolitica]
MKIQEAIKVLSQYNGGEIPLDITESEIDAAERAIQLMKSTYKKQVISQILQQTGMTEGQLLELLKPATVATPTKNNGNRIFNVLFEGETFRVINKRLPANLRDNPKYKELITTYPEYKDMDILLREYSPEYQAAYPINAEWKGNRFHLNDMGKLNAIATKYFDEYIKEYPNGSEKEFKQLVKL